MERTKPSIIIISGPQCSGKTTLAKKIKEKFNIPLIHKDCIKEKLFDTFGFREGDYELSKKLGESSFSILFHISERLLESRISHILDGPFDPKFANEQFLSLKKTHDFKLIQIILKTKKEERLRRFKSRYLSGERHPGHFNDKLIYEKNSIELLKDDYIDPVNIRGKVHYLDTTNFDRINYEELFNLISSNF